MASIAAHARVAATNPTNPDAWCVYGGSGQAGSSISGAETCVDYSGNFVPTVTNAQTLGTSALTWSNIYSVGETVTGNNSAGTAGTANAGGTGNATAPTATTIVGGIIFSPTAIGAIPANTSGIFGSTTIPYISTYETLLATAAAVVVTAVPSISTRAVAGTGAVLPNGTMLVLTSTAPGTITLQSQGTLTGSGLRLGSSTRVITIGNTLTLIWNATIGQWFEQSFIAGTGN